MTSHGEVDDRHVITIAFRQIECVRCQAVRIATQPCPDCGKSPDSREADPVLQRRIALVADVLRAFDESAHPVTDLDLAGAMREASALLGRVLEGLAKASSQAPDARDLIEAAGRLRQLFDWALHDAPRPWTNHKRAFAEALRSIERVARGFLHAFEARTPIEAQRLARRAQVELDASAAAIAEIGDRVDVMVAMADARRDSWVDTLSRVAFGAEFGQPAEPLLSVASAAASEVRKLTGVPQVPPGTAIAASLVIVPARALFDFENLGVIVRECTAILRGDPDRFRAVTSSDAWWASETHTQEFALDAVDTLLVVLEAERLSSRQVVRSLLQHIQDTVEGPVRHVTATLLAVATGESYESLVANYPTRLLTRVAGVGAATFANGLDADLRNASAHLDFEVDEDEDEVVLSVRKNPRHMSTESFGDALLAASEAVSAAALALVIAAEEIGVALPAPKVSDLGMVADALPRATLRLLGWEDVSLALNDRSVVAAARGPLQALIPTVGALLASVGDSVATFEFTVEAGDGGHVFHAPLLGFRQHQAAKSTFGDGLETDLAFVVAMSGCSLDGAPVLSKAAIRHYLAMRIGAIINRALPEAIQTIKLAREAARTIGDAEAVEVIGGAIAALRLVAQGLAVDAATSRHLETLGKWERDPHKSPFGALSS